MELEQELINAIRSSEHVKELEDLAENTMENPLVKKVLEEIPLIQRFYKAYRTYQDIRAYFFAKKITRFLTEVEKIPLAARQAFIEQHCDNAKDVASVGEIALVVLDRIDEPQLATLFGRAFSLFIQGIISRDTLEIYANIIKNLNGYLIRQLTTFYQENISVIDKYADNLLSNYGLVEIEHSVQQANTITVRSHPKKTEFGEYFVKNIIIPIS